MNFKEKLTKELKKQLKQDIYLRLTPSPEFGDYALFLKNPNKKVKSNLIERTEVKGNYLNIFINKSKFIEETLKYINKDYGSGNKKKETYMVEYFHANTHKGVHIGHLRNISLGESICKILEKYGHKVIRVNYQGDIGPHVAKCIWGYLNLKQKEPKEKKGIWLGKIYSLANKKGNEDEIKEINNKLYEKKDKKLMNIWKKTRKYCLDDFNKFYKEFGVKYNRLYLESEVENLGKNITKSLLKKGIAEKSEGALIVDLKKYNLGVYVLLTSNGNALYHTKDFGLAELKQKEFKFDKSIHVVGAEQTLYFKQLFKTFELTNNKLAKKSKHISYGLVMLPEGKMSSREGTMVLFDNLKEEMFKKTEQIIKQKHKKLSKKEIKERTEKIAYAALKFSMINRDNNKNLVFDWDQALSFEGETGPYIQYTHARICSILRKSKSGIKVDYTKYNPQEFQLIKKLSEFPDAIKDSAIKYKPNLLCNYLIQLSQLFNTYYSKHEIKISKERMLLASKIKQTISTGLNLLGIEAPESM